MSLTRDTVLLGFASLVIALMLRMALTPVFVPDRQREFDARLEFRNVNEALTVVDPPGSVKLVATGSSDDLDSLDTEAVFASVDLGEARAGRRAYPIEVMAPQRGRVEIVPRFPTIQLDVQKVASTEYEVELEFSGLLPSAFLFDGARSQPATVTVFGPESRLKDVSRVRVILDLSDVRPGGSYTLPVEVIGEDKRPLPFVRAQPSRVTVTPAVAPATLAKRVLVVPVWEGLPPFGYRVEGYEVRPSQVQVRGDSGVLAGFSTLETNPIDISGLTQTTTIATRLKVPPGVRVVEGLEIQVTLRVSPQRRPAPPRR